MKNKLSAVIVLFLMSGASVFAQAVDGSPAPKGRQDLQTPDGHQEWAAKHKMMWEKMAQMKADCADDVQKFCPSEQGHQRMQCLMKNKASLTTACKADMTKMEEFHKRHAKGAPPPAEDMKTAPPAETY